MKRWTTAEQLAWLKEKIPDWHKARRDKRQGGVWLEATILDFLDKFIAIPKADLVKTPKRIRKWFYHHGKLESPRTTAAAIDLLPKPLRKVVPLTPTQAYTLLYCKRDSDLYKGIHGTWKLYSAGDEAILKTYAHLFPTRHNPKIPFVTFQQAILRDKLSAASEAELGAIQELIDARFEEDIRLRERPWEASKSDDLQTSADLERAYVQDHVDGLSETLEAVCDEIKRVTNFNTFVLTGGPTPMGTGGFQVFPVESGETILTGQTFEQFLGPFWNVLKTKYGEWLGLSYSREELLRREGFIRGHSAAPSQPSTTHSPSRSPDPDTTSTPSQSPDPGVIPTQPTTTTTQPATTQPTTNPSQSPATSMTSGDLSTDMQTDSVPVARASSGTTPTSPTHPQLSTTNWETLDETLLDLDVSLDGIGVTLDGIDVTLDGIDVTLDEIDVTLDEIDVTLDETDVTMDNLGAVPSSPNHMSIVSHPLHSTSTKSPSLPSHVYSPAPDLVPTTNCSPTQSQGPWTPSHQPSWTLGPQHRPYVHTAVSYLVGVPGGAGWDKLLAGYITFESLSSGRSGSSRLPTNPRPKELARWFKCGRRFGKKDVPSIESVQDFEDEWVAWWSAAQPKWRNTSDWPFAQEDTNGRNWGSLADGGKDGLFLAMVSLGWWVIVRNPSEDSKVDEAIEDVTWVVGELISSLCEATTTRSDTMVNPPVSPSTVSRGKRPTPTKICSPSRRAKRIRA